MIDYRNLLIKYINHVGEQEGISFLNERYYFGGTFFSSEEWDELQNLDKILLKPHD